MYQLRHVSVTGVMFIVLVQYFVTCWGTVKNRWPVTNKQTGAVLVLLTAANEDGTRSPTGLFLFLVIVNA